MATILDLNALPPHERVDAFAATVVDRTVPSRFDVTPLGTVEGSIEWTALGPVSLLRTEVTAAQTMTRLAGHVRRGAPETLSIALRRHGSAFQDQFDVSRTLHPGDLYCTDLSAPFHYANTDGGTGIGLQIPFDRIGLPVDTIRRGAPRLPTSPVYPVIRDQLVELTHIATTLVDPVSADAAGAVVLELTRAVLASASGDERYGAGALAETAFARVRHHVRAHLSDAALDAASAAAAVGISPRRLYRLCQDNGVRFEQWIITARLDRAKVLLRSPGAATRSISSIAAACGFTDPSYFARRFRAATGVTPRDWRAGASGTPVASPRTEHGSDGRSGSDR